MKARRRRRPVTKPEAMTRAILRCSQALIALYRHPDATLADLRTVLAAVHTLHSCDQLRLTTRLEPRV